MAYETHSSSPNEEHTISGDNYARYLRDVQSVVISPAFRADWKLILFLIVLMIAGSMLAYSFPATLRRFTLFEVFGHPLGFVFPPILIIPMIVGLFVLHRRFNTRYIVTQDRLLQAKGLISFKRSVQDIHFADVTGVIVEQNIMGRILRYGTIREMPYCSPDEGIYIEGIGNPFQYKSLIERRLHADEEEKEEITETL